MEANPRKPRNATQALAALLLIALSATLAAPAATADPPVPPQPSVVETLLWLREAVMDYLSDMEPVGTIDILELPEEILERACIILFGDEDCPIQGLQFAYFVADEWGLETFNAHLNCPLFELICWVPVPSYGDDPSTPESDFVSGYLMVGYGS